MHRKTFRTASTATERNIQTAEDIGHIILYDYIVPSYDVLHTFSSRYLMEDLTEYMREKGVLPLDKATDIFYSSETASMIEDGVADLHCRSDRCLAEEISREYQESKNETVGDKSMNVKHILGISGA